MESCRMQDSYSDEMDISEALDFTSVRLDPMVTAETPVLDLSCKKQSTLTSSELVLFGSRSNSPANTEKQQRMVNATDAERKSPFEGRTFMVTPPSETDSPKKMKYESVYHTSNALKDNPINQHGGFSVLPMNISIPVVPSALATLMTQDKGTANPIQTVGASVTSAATSTTYCNGMMSSTTSPPDPSKKAPRPFKAYPKDPLSLTMGTTELMYDHNSKEAYSEFRKRMLESVRRSNEGTNIKMRRIAKSPILPTSTVDEKNAAYWERRRKNNEAAKRSRDARRAKEDEIAIRAAFLEQENMKLKYELVALRNETAKLRCMVYTN